MMYGHKNTSRRTADRRGGKMNQPRPTNEHHVHVMIAWGSDERYTRCSQAGCHYAEVNGRPATGRKERTRDATQQELFPELFA